MVNKFLCQIILFAMMIVTFNSAFAQPAVEDFKKVFRFDMVATSGPITVDGKVDEEAWQSTKLATDFWQKLPYFAEGADPRTEVRLTYDDKTLYISAICYQTQKPIIQSLKRDEYWDNDGIAIILDPLNTRTNAFIFGVTAAGAQWDALRSQISDVNADWSNKWSSAVQVTEEYWSMEMAIPLKILRYDPTSKEWGMNFVRNHLNDNEFHNWTAVPESFWPPDPAFAGNLVWDQAPKASKSNFNLIPYVSAGIKKQSNEKIDHNINTGIDARASITSTLNLDLTINSDFSNIEVDELVTNLTRFSIFLPEKRTFFLENSDLFADFGVSGARPFFSRTIGLDSKRQTVPILYGMRLTGNITPTSRIGVMNIHSLKSDNTASQNQSAVSYQKRFGRSIIQGMFLNRQAYNGAKTISGDYGRNTSLEGIYTSDNGQYVAAGSMHHSFKEGVKGSQGFYTAYADFTNPVWRIRSDNVYMQKNYFADMGFVARIENYDAQRDTTIRLGYFLNSTSVDYKYRPLRGAIARHNFGIGNEIILNSDGSFNERNTNISYDMVLRSRVELSFTINNTALDLLYPFSFLSDGVPLPSKKYNFTFINGRFKSDDRKTFSYSAEGRIGDFYNGSLHQIDFNTNLRVTPWGNIGVGYQHNKLSFPDEYGKGTISAVLGKMEIGFNTNVLWTTLFQFQDQNEFMGINSRLQWRFAPMSDIFLVYIDNYDIFNGAIGRQIQTNNRALVCKVNYWY